MFLCCLETPSSKYRFIKQLEINKQICISIWASKIPELELRTCWAGNKTTNLGWPLLIIIKKICNHFKGHAFIQFHSPPPKRSTSCFWFFLAKAVSMRTSTSCLQVEGVQLAVVKPARKNGGKNNNAWILRFILRFLFGSIEIYLPLVGNEGLHAMDSLQKKNISYKKLW